MLLWALITKTFPTSGFPTVDSSHTHQSRQHHFMHLIMLKITDLKQQPVPPPNTPLILLELQNIYRICHSFRQQVEDARGQWPVILS